MSRSLSDPPTNETLRKISTTSLTSVKLNKSTEPCRKISAASISSTKQGFNRPRTKSGPNAEEFSTLLRKKLNNSNPNLNNCTSQPSISRSQTDRNANIIANNVNSIKRTRASKCKVKRSISDPNVFSTMTACRTSTKHCAKQNATKTNPTSPQLERAKFDDYHRLRSNSGSGESFTVNHENFDDSELSSLEILYQRPIEVLSADKMPVIGRVTQQKLCSRAELCYSITSHSETSKNSFGNYLGCLRKNDLISLKDQYL